jgi:hypothetical protein
MPLKTSGNYDNIATLSLPQRASVSGLADVDILNGSHSAKRSIGD